MDVLNCFVGEKKKKVLKREIGLPIDFLHVQHLGISSSTSELHEKIAPSIEDTVEPLKVDFKNSFRKTSSNNNSIVPEPPVLPVMYENAIETWIGTCSPEYPQTTCVDFCDPSADSSSYPAPQFKDSRFASVLMDPSADPSSYPVPHSKDSRFASVLMDPSADPSSYLTPQFKDSRFASVLMDPSADPSSYPAPNFRDSRCISVLMDPSLIHSTPKFDEFLNATSLDLSSIPPPYFDRFSRPPPDQLNSACSTSSSIDLSLLPPPVFENSQRDATTS